MEKLSLAYNSIIQTSAVQFGLEHYDKPATAHGLWQSFNVVKDFVKDMGDPEARSSIDFIGVGCAVTSIMSICITFLDTGLFGRMPFIPKLFCATDVLCSALMLMHLKKSIKKGFPENSPRDRVAVKRVLVGHAHFLSGVVYQLVCMSMVCKGYMAGRGPSNKTYAKWTYGAIALNYLLPKVLPFLGCGVPEPQLDDN